MTSETEAICLTTEEVEGLRELLAWVAVVEERGFNSPNHVCEIAYETWHDMTRSPKQKLSRLTRPRMVAARTGEPT